MGTLILKIAGKILNIETQWMVECAAELKTISKEFRTNVLPEEPIHSMNDLVNSAFWRISLRFLEAIL